jgi:hypothetical protein
MIAANNFEDLDLSPYNLKSSIPQHYLTVTGIIKNIPTDITINEIKNLVRDNENVISIERILRKTRLENESVLVPSMNIKIVFYGNSLPPSIDLTYYRERVHPYVYKLRQCLKCWRYGHTLFNCKSSIRCNNCGENHDEEVCQNKVAICIHCKDQHKASAKECSERTRRNNINIIMATKNISYVEAQEQFPIFTNNSYSILENLTEFPSLNASNYSKVLKTNKNPLEKPKTKYSMAIKKPAKISKENIINKTVQIDKNLIYSFDPNLITPITGNPHKVTEFE